MDDKVHLKIFNKKQNNCVTVTKLLHGLYCFSLVWETSLLFWDSPAKTANPLHLLPITQLLFVNDFTFPLPNLR